MYAATLRARLASFDHAYAVAVQLRRATNRRHFVIRTGDPLQPFRATDLAPAANEKLLARVV